MSAEPRTCWVISDGRRGIENQALGLAEACARQSPLNIIRYTIENGKAFSAANPRLQIALKSKHTDYSLPKRMPDIAIGCGRQAIAPLMAIKKASPEVFTAYIQDPRIDSSNFDVIFAPEHDNLTGPNIETMIGSPNRVTTDTIVVETLKFADQLESLPMPRVAMLIGGDSKTHKLDKSVHGTHLAAARKAIAEGYSVMITTSRRTPAWAIKDYKDLEMRHDNIWLYDGTGDNPYFAFLGGADIILVSEDSTNMLTEACATAKPVFRLPMTGTPGKFQTLYNSLSSHCNVSLYSDGFESAPYPALTETDRMATQFWAHFDACKAVLN